MASANPSNRVNISLVLLCTSPALRLVTMSIYSLYIFEKDLTPATSQSNPVLYICSSYLPKVSDALLKCLSCILGELLLRKRLYPVCFYVHQQSQDMPIVRVRIFGMQNLEPSLLHFVDMRQVNITYLLYFYYRIHTVCGVPALFWRCLSIVGG